MTLRDIDKYNALAADADAQALFALEYFFRERTRFEDRQRVTATLAERDLLDLDVITRARLLTIESDTWKGTCRVCTDRGERGQTIYWCKGLGWVHAACVSRRNP